MSHPQTFVLKVPALLRDQFIAMSQGPERQVGYIEFADPNNPQQGLYLVYPTADPNNPITIPLKTMRKPNPPYIVFNETTDPAIYEVVTKPGERPPQRTFEQVGEIDGIYDAYIPITAQENFLGELIQNKLRQEDSRTVTFSSDEGLHKEIEDRNKLLLQQISREYDGGRTQKEKRARLDEDIVLKQLTQVFSQRPYYTFDELLKLLNQPKNHLTAMLDKYCIRHQSGELMGKYQIRDFNTLL